jgi:hypothetical protein
MTSRFEPSAVISRSTEDCAAWPSASMTMTAAMPMMMPRVERQVRS